MSATSQLSGIDLASLNNPAITQMVSDMVSQSKWDEAYAALVRVGQQNPAAANQDSMFQYSAGLLAFNSGKMAEAELHFKTALSIRADFADAHYQLGLVMLKEKRAEEAMPEFREACEHKEGFAVGHLHWGMALMEMGSFRGALGQFNQAIKLDPKLVAAYIQGGLASFRVGQFLEAAQYFQAAVNNDPDLPEPLVCLGIALAALGNDVDAGKCFVRAWQMDGKDIAILRYAASTLATTGRIEDAVKLYQEAVNLGHRNLTAQERALIYNDWGASLFKVGRTEDAGEKLLEAAEMDPGSIEPSMNSGLVSVNLGEYERAVAAFKRAASIQPENNEIKVYLAVTQILLNQCGDALRTLKAGDGENRFAFWIGHAYLGAGYYRGAIESFQKVLAYQPNNFQAHDGLGCAYLLSGDYQAAIDRFMNAIQIRGDYALGHLHLSRALEETGNNELAKRHLAEAINYDPTCLTPQKEALDLLVKAAHYEMVENRSRIILSVCPDDQDVKVALAQAFREQGRHDEALELVSAVINANPGNATARIVAGQVYLLQGRFMEADEMFREADQASDGDPDPGLFFYWGKALALLGMHELALEKYEKASELDPYDADVYDAWGAALKTLGRFGDAAEVYRRAADYI